MSHCWSRVCVRCKKKTVFKVEDAYSDSEYTKYSCIKCRIKWLNGAINDAEERIENIPKIFGEKVDSTITNFEVGKYKMRKILYKTEIKELEKIIYEIGEDKLYEN